MSPWRRPARSPAEGVCRLLALASVASLARCGAQAATCPADADWIVVGGGGAGCAVAAALADAGEDVVVLERGPSDRDPAMSSTQSMHGWPRSVNDAGQLIRWKDGPWGVVANVLGGGTSLNGGFFFADRPEWFARALPGVDLKRMYASYEALRGQLATPAQPTQFGLDWNKVLTQGGYGEANLSSPSLEWLPDRPFLPYSTFNVTAPGAPRFGSAALLHRRAGARNLRVVTEALVQRVVFEGRRATGVEVVVGRSPNRQPCGVVRAKRAVVVSAGAIMTPQLLQVSGVGPQSLLQGLDVDVVSELPVGSNFTDRLIVNMGYISPSKVPFTIGYTVGADLAKNMFIEGVGGGQISIELGLTSLALVAPQAREPELRNALRALFDNLPSSIRYRLDQMMLPVALQTDTHSRGHVEAVSRSVGDPPRVTANFFQDPRDWESQKQRFRELLRLGELDAVSKYTIPKDAFTDEFAARIQRIAPEVMPALMCLFRSIHDHNYTRLTLPCSPAPYSSQDAEDKYLRDTVISSYHYFGTAAVGSVVDEKDFSVKGTEGLHVVDASVIPIPTTVNPQGTVMALGHYAGTLLAEQKGRAAAPAMWV